MTDEIVEPTEDKPARAPRKTAAKADALPQSIHAIIPLIREELGAISKDDEATAGAKFKYRGHDQIVNAIVPLFNKYGVFTTVEDEHLVYSGRPAANNKWATAAVISKRVTFHAPDGSSVSSTIVAESVDNGNKATSQAQTYAYRIALTQTFTIPTGEPDPDSTTGDFGVGNSTPVAEPTQPAVASAPVDELRARVKELFAARDITAKEEIQARGTKFFNGREGWEKTPAALNKLIKALEAGEMIGD